MAYFRALYAVASVGVCAYLCKPIKNKLQNNFLKVNAQPNTRNPPTSSGDCPNTPGGWDVFGDWEDLDLFEMELEEEIHALFNEPHDFSPWTKDAVNVIGDRDDLSWVEHADRIEDNPNYPTIKRLKGGVFHICCNYQTGMPDWTIQRVRTIDIDPCVQCKATADPERSNPDREYILTTLNATLQQAVLSIDPCVYAHMLPQKSRSSYQSNSLWTDLYHYVNFLTTKYKNVYLCSGPLYSIRKKDVGPCHPKDVPIPRIVTLKYFFRVIVGEKEDGSYRFECYQIPNAAILEEHPDLSAYQVPRSKVEQRGKRYVFEDVEPCMISESIPDKGFCPQWKCPRKCSSDS